MYRFAFKAYRRSFARAFSNAREDFAKREGLLLRLEDGDGRVGFGEAAPIESFGSESFVSALAAAGAIGERLEFDRLAADLSDYPALSFGIESAIEMIGVEGVWPALEKPWPVCGLVADLVDATQTAELLRMGFRCLKFKIGKGSFLEERRALDEVVSLSEGAVALRLDANASLETPAAVRWLESVAELPVEFLEQPLAKGREDEMQRLAGDFPTPIALDESVCSVDDLKRWRDAQWPGVFVLKPSLVGSYRELLAELEDGECDCVFSSSLETMVGSANAIGLALRHPFRRRALGFGVDGLFADRAFGLTLGPFLQRDALPDCGELEELWNRI